MKKFLVVNWVLIFTLLTFLPITALYAGRFSPFSTDRFIGKSAPDFTVKDLSGKKISLSHFKGKPILLNFWATWCPYCGKERALLNSLYKEYKNRGLTVVSISIGESPKIVGKHLKSMPVDFLVFLDEGREAAGIYDVVGLPTSFLVSRDGIIRHKFVGLIDWTDDESKKLIEELLKR